MKLILAIALLASATVSQAETRRSGAAHMRPQLFHDRTPHIHNRAAQPHHAG